MLKTCRIKLLIIVLVCMFSLLTSCSNVGRLYTLEEVYNNKLIDKEDLLEIAYYYNNVNVSGIELEIEQLSKSTVKQIKRAYKNEELKDLYFIDLDKIYVYKYYETYNDCKVVEVRSDYIMIDCYFYEEYIIDGVKFLNFTNSFIRVYVK